MWLKKKKKMGEDSNGLKVVEGKLSVVKQTCLAEENYTVNGKQKNVHVVIKNQPFFVELAVCGNLSSTDRLSFRHLTIEANLLYDTPDNSIKEVGWIKVKPLEYQGHMDEHDDLKFKLEVYIKILSSQHEDSLFKLLLRAKDAKTGKLIPGLEVTSKEMLVISKPEVLRKKNEPRTKKRTRDDVLLEALSRIESKLEQQQQAIQQLQKERRSESDALTAPKSESMQVEPIPSKTDLESSVVQFMNAFHALDHDERPEKVRKVLRQFSARENEKLFEIFDLFMAEGLQRQVVRDLNPFAFDFQDQGYFGSVDSPTSSIDDEESGSFFVDPSLSDVCLSLN